MEMIRKLMKDRGFKSVYELAKAFNLDTTYAYSLLKTKNPGLRRLVDIKQKLNLTPDELFKLMEEEACL